MLCSIPDPKPDRFVDLGFDRYHMEKPKHEPLRMQVITNRIGNAGNRGRVTRADAHLSPMTNFVFFCALYSFLKKQKKTKTKKPKVRHRHDVVCHDPTAMNRKLSEKKKYSVSGETCG